MKKIKLSSETKDYLKIAIENKIREPKEYKEIEARAAAQYKATGSFDRMWRDGEFEGVTEYFVKKYKKELKDIGIDTKEFNVRVCVNINPKTQIYPGDWLRNQTCYNLGKILLALETGEEMNLDDVLNKLEIVDPALCQRMY